MIFHPMNDQHQFAADISRREYFAAHALQGLLANPSLMEQMAASCNGDTRKTVTGLSHMATSFADGLIERLNESPKSTTTP